MRLQVADLSRMLAVRTLQLQLEYVAASLEDETLDIVQNAQNAGFLLFRVAHAAHAMAPVSPGWPCPCSLMAVPLCMSTCHTQTGWPSITCSSACLMW